MIFRSQNPWSGEILAEFQSCTEKEIRDKLLLSEKAFQFWSGTSVSNRIEKISVLISVLKRDSESLAFAMSEEMGKPLVESRAEIRKSISLIQHYCQNAEGWLADSSPMAGERRVLIRHQPLGGILLVMPWNFPLWQVIRAAVPALCAGNVILLKHAPNVFRFSALIRQIFFDAGFPEGVFQEFRVDVSQLESLVSHRAVAAVSLTGSEAAGRSMAALAGKHLKKCVLELGGSDPFIVLKDADIDKAARLAASSRMINNGQSCIAAKRFLVQEEIMEEFSFRMMAELSAFQPGNPCLNSTRLGPLARPDLAENLRRQMESSVNSGARILFSMKAEYPENSPFFLPVLLGSVSPEMPVFREETFGPLACLCPFRSVEEAVRLANATNYGLGSSVHTKNENLALEIAGKLDCGTVAINTLMRSDPSLPFGGIKDSGYGREMAEEGMKEFCNLKVIMLD